MKSKLPTYANNDEPAPPSYTESFSSSYSSPATSKISIPVSSPSSSSTYGIQAQIQTQLSHLSTQYHTYQTQKTLLAHAHEQKILSLLTDQIQIYLSEFATTGLRKGTLIMIPAHCLANENATPLEFGGEDTGVSAYDVFVEVGDTDKESLEVNGGVWYWEDEDMAERLAGSLNSFAELPSRQAVAQQNTVAVQGSGSSSSRFWIKKNCSKNVENVKINEVVAEWKDQVLMDVKAEEVVFEYENSFGLLETQRGYGVVLHLEIVTRRW
ncbi:hypothetical protein SBOR_9962 [Sclerotinia borealis F-4128]|uniref:Uncharacterized protein n=1 Tax=Sclerotinia borealis (strain F-4128) TaxID=1432307 RepID=W9C1P4_SCLBF|nr:hypothetical protein SBOR_9962 [Sclerotinia borealis F-4128]